MLRQYPKQLLYGVVLLVTMACSGSPSSVKATVDKPSPSANSSTAKYPSFDLDAQLHREVGTLETTVVRDEQGRWQAEVAAAQTPTVEIEDGVALLTLPLGTTSPINCYVYPDAIEPAAALSNILDGVARSVKMQTVQLAEVRPVADYGALFVESFYTAELAEKTVAGSLKLAVVAREEYPVLCLHDELGYRNSFRRITYGLFKTLRKTEREKERIPHHFEFWLLTLGQDLVGYETKTVHKNRDKTFLFSRKKAVLIPQSNKLLLAGDTAMVELVDKRGAVVRGSSVYSEQGNIQIQVSFRRIKGRKYRYEGLAGEQKINGQLIAGSNRGIISDLQIQRRTREMVRQQRPGRFVVEQYLPLVYPLQTVKALCQLSMMDRGGRLKITVGEQTLYLLTDQNGMYKEQGGLDKSQQRRVFAERVESRGTMF